MFQITIYFNKFFKFWFSFDDVVDLVNFTFSVVFRFIEHLKILLLLNYVILFKSKIIKNSNRYSFIYNCSKDTIMKMLKSN